MSRLNALKIKSISRIGMHSDGNGLYLKVQKSIKANTPNKSWIFRWGAKGANTMGLGSLKDVTLAEAREFASECHRMVTRGINPRDERQRIKAEQVAEASSSITFRVAAQQYIETHQASWKSIKHAQQWHNTLETYAFDKIGKVACADLTKAQVLAILKPIWTDKHETATRLRGRIESVLDWAIAKGYRAEANPAVLKGNLQPLLPHFHKRQRVKHHNAMSYDDVPNFFATIKDDPTISARALVFCILTATRTSEAVNAKWSEIDFTKRTWIIPKERMKRGIEHRVPLASQVCEMLGFIKRADNDYIFCSEIRKTKPISNMTMLQFLQRKEGLEKLTVHGFRSSFRDWAAEKGNFPREVCEQALAHALTDQTEAAYQRADYFEKRVALMQGWADYCLGIKKVDESARVDSSTL